MKLFGDRVTIFSINSGDYDVFVGGSGRRAPWHKNGAGGRVGRGGGPGKRGRQPLGAP